MFTQIITGSLILVVSFLVGYFLSMSQRKEALRVELFRRKLDVYDGIMAYLQKVDKLILKKQGVIEGEQGKIMSQEVRDFAYLKRPYLSKKIYYLLEFELAEVIKKLPDSLSELEKIVQKISEFISKETGAQLIAPKEMENITGQKEEQ